MADPRERHVAFVMADLSGFSALTAAHGDRHAVEVVTRFVAMTEAALAPGTRLLERVGDQVLIVSPDAEGALRTALPLRHATEQEPLFPAIRTGVHVGPVMEQGGSYFGTTLNLTARVSAHARPGQVLCTEAVAAGGRGLEGVDFRDLGPVRFKNLVDPVRVFEVLAGPRAGDAMATDPVCRMQIEPATAPARLPWAGGVSYFCSFECARAFALRPEAYAAP